MELVATIFAAVSAFAAAVAAYCMFEQTKLATGDGRREAQERAELQRRENRLLAVNNQILINQMSNDFNRSVVEGDENSHGNKELSRTRAPGDGTLRDDSTRSNL